MRSSSSLIRAGARSARRLAVVVTVLATVALAGCASLQVSGPRGSETAAIAAAAATAAVEHPPAPANGAPGSAHPASAATTAAAAAASAAAQAAQAAKPFAEVTKDATEQKGLFNLWRKDDKVWIELAPDQLDHPYFFKSALNQGIGEKGIFGGAMTRPIGVAQIVVFHKHGQSIQLIAKNVKYTAAPGTPEAFGVAAGFSDSLLSTAPIASQPKPGTKSILVDANALLFTDIPGASTVLERTYRQAYAFDARNSSFGKLWANPDDVALEVSAHYSLGHIALPPPPPARSTLPPPPSTLPDIRSLFLGYYYTFATLPTEPMHTRVADDRIGYFTTDRFDFTSDLPRLPIEHFIDRWRLEKKDPSAPLSEPKQPIVYWLDRDIPVKYREPIREGILEWNKAFEKIGFKDAIKVEVQPDNADFDTSDIHHASVRWQTVAQNAYSAIGPSVVDPRTGEILDADIGIDANNIRTVRSLRREYIPPPSDAYRALAGPLWTLPGAAGQASGTGFDAAANGPMCSYASAATEEAAFGLSLLELRGEIAPDGPGVDRFVDAYLKAVVMHEVGHTLGLRHNFRASTVYTEAELSDPAFTRTHGIAGSVMEYNPWNIATRGERQGAYDMTTLGPYDYWAIEYGYREVPAAGEAAALASIAGRSSEHELAFASDEDVFVFGIDPDVNVLDLGEDPLAYAKKRFELVHELWQRTETLQLAPGESYSVLMRNFTRGFNQAAQGALYAVKYIGGLTTLRDRAGSGRAPLTPVDPAKQREALAMLANDVLSATSFRFEPAFLRRLTASVTDMRDAGELGRPAPPLDVSIDEQVATLQKAVLDRLMSPLTAQRLLNNESKVDEASRALRLPELYRTLHEAVWSELARGGQIPLARRNLQREYVRLVADALIKPSSDLPADARALLRVEAKSLRGELANAGSRGRSIEARAHVAEMQATLDEALKAPILRQGP
jgi:hypothetical protein